MIDAIEACALMIKGICMTKPQDEWTALIEKRIQFMLKSAERADAEKDAARYRWLREQHWNESPMVVVCDPKTSVKLGFDCPSSTRLDEAIDAAILAAKEKKS